MDTFQIESCVKATLMQYSRTYAYVRTLIAHWWKFSHIKIFVTWATCESFPIYSSLYLCMLKVGGELLTSVCRLHHQQKAHDILKKAWDAPGSPFKGTPFDPTRVNIAGVWWPREKAASRIVYRTEYRQTVKKKTKRSLVLFSAHGYLLSE